MSKLKKRVDGLYQISVKVTEGGKQKRKYFYGHTQQEAKKKMLDWQADQSAGRTFDAVADEWQREHWKEISAGTQTCYNPAYKRAMEDFSGRRISTIHPLDVKQAVDGMAAKGYAHHSVVIYLSVLNQIFTHALLMKDISDNPTEPVSVPKGLSSTTRECPEEDELEIIRKNVDHPFGLFPYMLLYTGLRRGEILALQWKDVDFDKRTISVRKSVSYAATGNQPEIKSTKTEAGERDVILLDRLGFRLYGCCGKPAEYIFGGEKPMTQSVFTRSWRNYCLDTGLWRWKSVTRQKGREKIVVQIKEPTVTPHQLRHAFATMCFEICKRKTFF